MATSVSAKRRFPSYCDNSVASTDFPINKIRGNGGTQMGRKNAHSHSCVGEFFSARVEKGKKVTRVIFLVGCICQPVIGNIGD